jgi:thiol-disulfide isomerase/thioredoxin
MKKTTQVLRTGLILIAIFCASFYFFYKRAQSKLPKEPQQPLFLTSAVINRPLPKSNLVSYSGNPLDDEKIRHGKFVLVFMMPDCKPCDEENDFLRTVAGSRKNISFVYVIPFGRKEEVLKLAQSKYSLEPFYDEGSTLSKELQLYQVPVKVFLEDGVIKKTWAGSEDTDQKKAEFRDWLGSV